MGVVDGETSCIQIQLLKPVRGIVFDKQRIGVFVVRRRWTIANGRMDAPPGATSGAWGAAPGGGAGGVAVPAPAGAAGGAAGTNADAMALVK